MTTAAKKATMIKDTGQYAFASYIVQGIGIVNSILLRRFMGPAAMGAWSILQVVLGYCGYASVGTTKALARDYPYYRGKGDTQKAEKIKNVTLTFTMLMSLIPCAALMGYVLYKGESLPQALRFGFLFIAFFLFIQRFFDFLINLLRAEKRFDTLSRLIVLNAAAGLLVSLVLVRPWRLYGMLLGTAAATFLCLIFAWIKGRYQFRFQLERQQLHEELRLGVPLILAGFLSEILRSLDKLLIAKHLGLYEVGLYSIGPMVHAYVLSLPMMFSHVWFPNLQEDYGRQGNVDGVRSYLLKPLMIFSVIIPFIIGLAVYGVPVLVQFFIPKFITGLDAMKIYLLGAYFLALAQFGSSFLITLDKPLLNAAVVGVAIAVNYGFITFSLQQGWGLSGAAIATTLGCMVYGLSVYGIAGRYFSDRKFFFGKMFQSLLIFATYTFFIFLIDRQISHTQWFINLTLKFLYFLAVSSAYLVWLEKQTKALSLVTQVFLKRG